MHGFTFMLLELKIVSRSWSFPGFQFFFEDFTVSVLLLFSYVGFYQSFKVIAEFCYRTLFYKETRGVLLPSLLLLVFYGLDPMSFDLGAVEYY